MQTFPPGKLQKQKRPTPKLGTSNVRTMLTSHNVKLKDINDFRKTAIINDELLKLNVDIATLQEARLADTGTIKEITTHFIGRTKIVMNVEYIELTLQLGTLY